MEEPSHDTTQRAQVESVAEQFTVNEIDASGNVTLEPELSVQETIARQIGQLWEAHANFQGLSDLEEDEADEAKEENADSSTEPTKTTGDAELDAYGVRAKVHEQLTLAQSEIQVSLDMVRLLLAAKKRAARALAAAAASASQQQQSGTALAKHEEQQTQQQHDGTVGFAARVGGDVGDEVTVGGVPFRVGLLDTVRVDAQHGSAQMQQQRRREEELRFVLGAKHRQLADAADTLERSAHRLQRMRRAETGFWRTAFELRRRNWLVLHHRQLLAADRARRAAVPGDRYFVPFGYTDSGSSFAEDALAEILRPEEDPDEDEDSRMDTEDSRAPEHSRATPVFVPLKDRRCIAVDLCAASPQHSSVLGSAGPQLASAEASADLSSFDRLHRRLLRARRAMFDRELYYRLCREARVLELGSMRTVETPGAGGADSSLAVRDVLMATLSRDGVAVRLQWSLQDPEQEEPNNAECHGSEFVRWQARYYSRLALVMAAMFQRRLHRVAKAYQLGSGLSSHVLLSSAARGQLPEAFASAAAAPQGEGAAAAHDAAGVAVGRPELLLLSPVLQALQFARWQHIMARGIQRACRAWRGLVDEPIEVISHLVHGCQIAQLIQQPGVAEAVGSNSETLAYVVRMRFLGGTVMSFWLDAHGHLYFVKGYYPPSMSEPQPAEPKDNKAARQEQTLIRRVFRVVPLGGLGEFVDQLRRELQSLVLLRVAAALTRCGDYEISSDAAGNGTLRAGVGQWHVHQSQMCVVGEWWQGARHRQIVGVAKWDSADAGAVGTGQATSLAGSSEGEQWRLTLYFGPKHPTAFDIPPQGLAACGPWSTCYPLPPSTAEHSAPTPRKSFEENLLDTLVHAF
ncbi:hypothetical protein H4R20_004758 [Coemansia guatemalensis]|uniref:Mediator of RNA polymerase II transcription subunit 17 n=1 Tax=Coemansia guatemalensis TaxID=2761395 RepID=A0A9W8HT37_9FUNG|nr:hypothetical protein H4R20_004758 [Coemansia guatemalensis]